LNEVTEKIIAEIRKQGVLSVARFMELALYCPVYGYYEKEADRIGRRGDYYTSVSVGRLFGELLAWQFSEWFSGSGRAEKCQESGGECHRNGHGGSRVGNGQRENPVEIEEERAGGLPEFQIVEAGAHRGALARDILGWLKEWRGDVYQHLEYCIVEPSSRRREWQKETLKDFGGKVVWAGGLGELGRRAVGDVTAPGTKAGHAPLTRQVPPRKAATPQASFRILFSNELLDALPVHRLGWDAGRRAWFEWGVTLEDGRLAWTRMPIPSHLVPAPSPVEAVLPDGFTYEVSPAAIDWWRQAANALPCGRLIAFDYGLTSEEILTPERCRGTLRAYSRHMQGPDVLSKPGEQDITAHVNFSALQQAGEAAGLTTEVLVTQGQFLTGIAEKIFRGPAGFGEWTSARTRQFQTLTHPEHLGHAFRVLIQCR
jgi:SAM-dependent MidA family methyltransferase